jgi:LPXTG-site transpeptidase (sortase) family protein
LDTLVVHGVDNETLRAGPGHDPLSDRPGEKGNCIIAAHRNIHGAPFWYLSKLVPNTLVNLQTADETLVYKVAFARLVTGSDTGVLERSPNPLAAPRLTLYTCTLPKSDNRFIVVANLIERQPATSLPLDRKAVFPLVTSGPLHLLKDPALRRQLKLPPLAPKRNLPLNSRVSRRR